MINYSISNGSGKIGDLNQYEKDSIYIFYKDNVRIYIINQRYYKFKDGKLNSYTKRYLDQDEIYQIKILTKIVTFYPKLKKFKR